jgi:F-type H+-transporting ATPase subunit delta
VRNQVIAKRYSKALFSLAQDGGWVGQYGKELDDFVQLLKDNPELADAVQNPLFPEATRKSLFKSVVDRTEMSPVVRSFINLLLEKKRVQHLGEIAEYYHKLIDEHSNVARAQIKAATQLDEQVIQEIAQTLENMTGKRIVVEFEQDPSLIGGVVARIGDLVLDGSVKRQLINFKESMKRGMLG